jgi:hypothetical protein
MSRMAETGNMIVGIASTSRLDRDGGVGGLESGRHAIQAGAWRGAAAVGG